MCRGVKGRACDYSFPYEDVAVLVDYDPFRVLLFPKADFPGVSTTFRVNNRLTLNDCKKTHRTF